MTYPSWICADCGTSYGRTRLRHYATFHFGTCGICKHNAPVTEPRDYGHLRDGWQREAAP